MAATPAFFQFTFSSPQETAIFGAALAPHLKPGDVILLTGDIGAGKTHFARSVVQARLVAAGMSEEVPSPTYTLVQTYDDGLCEIWHADLYRLGGPDDVIELGLVDAFSDAICLVEWPDRLGSLAPKNALTMEMSMAEGTGKRNVKFHGDANHWRHRLDIAPSARTDV